MIFNNSLLYRTFIYILTQIDQYIRYETDAVKVGMAIPRASVRRA